jgi:hypothetical protein
MNRLQKTFLGLTAALLTAGVSASQPAWASADPDESRASVNEIPNDDRYELLDIAKKGQDKGAMADKKKPKQMKNASGDPDSTYFLIEDDDRKVASKSQ